MGTSQAKIAAAQNLRGHLRGRRRGHRLRPRQARLLSTLLPRLRVPLGSSPCLDPLTLFEPGLGRVWLEIGFGSAEHLVWQAERHPEVGLIGVEPFINGIAKLLAAVEERRLSNIRIHDDDFRGLIERLAPGSLERVFILFPDPWPKTRHHKRRIINDDTVAGLARVVQPGGTVRIASDVPGYTSWILQHMRRATAFEWMAGRAQDWRLRPPDWPATRYEEKALAAGRRPVFLTYRRR